MPAMTANGWSPTRPQVDAAVDTVDGHCERVVELERHAEIAGKQVAGAEREERDRQVGADKGAEAGHHRAVAAADHDELHARRDGGLGHAGARILRRGLQPQGRRPAGGGQRLVDLLP